MLGFRFVLIAVPVAVALLTPLRLSSLQERTPAEYAALLEGAERVARLQVARVVAELGLSPGERVADIGSGSGLFTRPLAEAVGPDGVAYAVDIDRALLDLVAASSRKAGLTNLRTVLAAPHDPSLPEPVDVVLICDTLHHIGNQGPYLRRLARYVKPEGRVAVIDFSDTWPDGHDRMRYRESDLDKWMREAGFARSAAYDYLENSFFVIYRKEG